MPYFIGSVLCYLGGKSKISLAGWILEIVAFIVLENVWIAACIMGGCLFKIVNSSKKNIFSKWYFFIPVIAISWFVIQRKESEMTYLIDALVSLALLLVLFSNESIQKILGFSKMLSTLGKYSMEIFLIHPLIYSKIGKRFFIFLSEGLMLDINLVWFLTWIASLILIVILAIPTKKIIDITNRGILRFLSVFYPFRQAEVEHV